MNAPLHELPLPGLSADNPRDFLAALGLLRLVDHLWPAAEPRLSWREFSNNPVVSTGQPLASDWDEQLVSALQTLVEHPECPLFYGEIIKTDAPAFRHAVERAVAFATSGHPLARLPQLLLAAYSSQLTDDGGAVEPTDFSFANGQSGKKLLLDVRQLIAALDAPALAGALAAAANPVAAKSLRWNPVEFRPAAYRSHDPGRKMKGDETRDHPALNVLAFFGLSFFPAIPTLRGAETLGFHRLDRGRCFMWPIWRIPLTADEVGTVTGATPEQWTPAAGIAEVWRSRRFSSDKSLYFAPAVAGR